MTTEAQRARNARKRAKLKQHRREQKPWREVAGPGWSKVIVTFRRTDGFCQHMQFICMGDIGRVETVCSWHPAYKAWLNHIIRCLSQSGAVAPGSIQAYQKSYQEDDRDYPVSFVGYRLVDLELDLNELIGS